MLDKFIVHVKGKTEFDEKVDVYFVNMTNNLRTIHITGKCYYAKCCNDFIPFSSMDEIKKFEARYTDATPFKRCGNCFRNR